MIPGAQWLHCAAHGTWKWHCDGRRKPLLTRISKAFSCPRKLAVFSRNNFTSSEENINKVFHLFQTSVRDIELLCRKKIFSIPTKKIATIFQNERMSCNQAYIQVIYVSHWVVHILILFIFIALFCYLDRENSLLFLNLDSSLFCRCIYKF